ncbi:TetR/AcrR family transcriptional regulator [Lutimonas saemankumensis]|uniref:TetR/AcrR family transcriptional regulator n=1 Tax=Lutimonas saemankumensis TaxID=483016 RepID=UPI001CD39791|nr:TetR/AcrR family transcriptional regulator [Lutimonas saemankumensis]MCA0933209.1 TetR/AcrR family transcriptional regulator [Lutimonas saemankumensis]
MKEKILEKASDMFLNLGFKSVTMDDIAHEMGISKKTIYAHFPTKQELVQATTFFVLEKVHDTICMVCSAKHDPIKEIFTIKTMVNDQLKNEKSSPSYQLQKYYPKIFKQLKEEQFQSLNLCIEDNLKRGIKEEYYRKGIDIDLITRFYLSGIMNLSNREFFPSETYRLPDLKDAFLEYHVRAIATEKGLKTLSNILRK